jgi:hypothetical protein
MLGRISVSKLISSFCTPKAVKLDGSEQSTDTKAEQGQNCDRESGVSGPLLPRFNPRGRKPSPNGAEKRESHKDPGCQRVAWAFANDENDASDKQPHR